MSSVPIRVSVSPSVSVSAFASASASACVSRFGSLIRRATNPLAKSRPKMHQVVFFCLVHSYVCHDAFMRVP